MPAVLGDDTNGVEFSMETATETLLLGLEHGFPANVQRQPVDYRSGGGFVAAR